MNITNELKNKTINGVIKEKEAIAIGEKADNIISEAVRLLNRCYNNVGLDVGSEIKALTSRLQGIRFNEKEYFHEKTVEGQDT